MSLARTMPSRCHRHRLIPANPPSVPRTPHFCPEGRALGPGPGLLASGPGGRVWGGGPGPARKAGALGPPRGGPGLRKGPGRGAGGRAGSGRACSRSQRAARAPLPSPRTPAPHSAPHTYNRREDNPAIWQIPNLATKLGKQWRRVIPGVGGRSCPALRIWGEGDSSAGTSTDPPPPPPARSPPRLSGCSSHSGQRLGGGDRGRRNCGVRGGGVQGPPILPPCTHTETGLRSVSPGVTQSPAACRRRLGSFADQDRPD